MDRAARVEGTAPGPYITGEKAAPGQGRGTGAAREEGTVMATHDAYATLGLDPRCTDAQIVAMYRHLVKLHHPDRGGDAKRFREIQDAYDAIGSSGRRASYDQERARAQRFTVRDDVPKPGARDEDERYDAAYRRVRPDWERDLRDWLNHQARQQAQQPRGETGDRDGNGETHTQRDADEQRRVMRTVQRRTATAAAAAGGFASILRWAQTGTNGSTRSDDVAASILAAGARDHWTWFAIVVAAGIVGWAQILRPGTKTRTVRTGAIAAIAAATLAGAGANPLSWQAGAWLAAVGAFLAAKRGWGSSPIGNRIKNRIKDRIRRRSANAR